MHLPEYGGVPAERLNVTLVLTGKQRRAVFAEGMLLSRLCLLHFDPESESREEA